MAVSLHKLSLSTADSHHRQTAELPRVSVLSLQPVSPRGVGTHAPGLPNSGLCACLSPVCRLAACSSPHLCL